MTCNKVKCAVSITRFPGSEAGNQCCYKDGNLCTEVGCGGTVDKISPRSDDLCVKHYYEDIFPAMHCPPDQMPNYIDKRPIDDGSRFQPPDPPGMYVHIHFYHHCYIDLFVFYQHV